MTASSPVLAGHLLVDCLVAQGVTHAFGVPGESFLAVLDGFHAHRDRIRFVINRQEGGAAFMAEAVGKLTGRPGVCFVTRGPGATNASIGIHTAFQDSTPLVVIVGQVGAEFRDREAFQELDYRQFFGPGTLGMAKWAAEVGDAARLPEYIARAFHTALQGLELDVEAMATRFGVPMSLIVETVRVHRDDIHRFKQAMTVVLRGRIVRFNDTPVEEVNAPPDAQWVLNGDRGLSR